MKTLDYILIDPFEETVTLGSFDYEKRDKEFLKNLYRIIGCTCVDSIQLEKLEHDIVIDDEGIYNTPAGKPAKHFTLDKYALGHIIAGRGVVVRWTKGGDWVSNTIQLSEIKDNIKFHDKNSALRAAAKFECEFDEYRENKDGE